MEEKARMEEEVKKENSDRKFSLKEAEEIFIKGAYYAYCGIDEPAARNYFRNRIKKGEI